MNGTGDVERLHSQRRQVRELYAAPRRETGDDDADDPKRSQASKGRALAAHGSRHVALASRKRGLAPFAALARLGLLAIELQSENEAIDRFGDAVVFDVADHGIGFGFEFVR